MANATPASRVEAFQVTVPAGTTQAAPLVTSLRQDPGEVTHVAIRIPAGHASLTGIQLRIAGGQVIPLTRGAWIVGNGETKEWNLTGQLNSGAWQAYTYNTDVYDHSFYLEFSILDFAFGGGAATAELLPTPLLV